MTNKKKYLYAAIILAIAVAAVFYLLTRPDLSGEIIIPYISHQKPTIDPHLPSSNPLSDKLDEVQFDGLFNLSANPSGVVYQDGLGEFLGIDATNIVTVRLTTNKRWHDSYNVTQKDDKITINRAKDHVFTAHDLSFTLKRIQSLGSLSPDYILVSQAMENIGFEGPDEGNIIRFKFREDRIWKEADIKEVLSFKILPDNSPINALNYTVGTAAYLALPPQAGVSNYYRNPEGGARIPNLILSPFIDNSTYPTELRNGSINVLLETPFGSLSPILADNKKFFAKSNISTTFFALLFNTERLSREQRRELRKLVNTKMIVDRFFKVGSPQQRHIVDYKGNRDNYGDYINRSIFPSSSYYLEEKVVEPAQDDSPMNLSLLPDSIRINVCVNFGFREEFSELIEILNDPSLTRGMFHVRAVQNDEIQRGEYDAVLMAFSGYRSNFLFDLYDILLREPNLETYKINLSMEPDERGVMTVSPTSFEANRNFFRLDPERNIGERDDIKRLLHYVYGFMSTRQIGDKQQYARRIDELEQQMSLGAWLFSMPSLAYFNTQFDSTSIDLYGVASQLSTIRKWAENPAR